MSDLISRSALLEEVKFLTVTVMGLRAGKGVLHEYAKQYKDTLLRIINDQPTIEAVPVVYGELVYTNDDIPPHCSVCSTIIHADSKYCRECGTRLVVERNE